MIAELWARLDSCSRQHGFNLLAELNEPATSSDLAALTAMPWTIPEALLESLRLHDGERDSFRGSPLFGGSRLLSATEMLSQREATLEALLDMVEEADPEAEYDLPIGIGPVRAQPCHPDWLPILSVCARVNFYLDFAPLEGGVSGQIIRVDVETGENVVCANSYAEFLAAYVEAVEGGQFKLGKHGLQWPEPWPALAALPWLQPALLDASRIDAVGRASSWGCALKLARGVLSGPELLRVRARAVAAAGLPRLAEAVLDVIRAAGAETPSDLKLRLEFLEQRGRHAELEPLCGWRLDFADVLLICQNWAEAEANYSHVIQFVEAMEQPNAAARRCLAAAQQGRWRAQHHESSSEGTPEALELVNELCQSLNELPANHPHSESLAHWHEVRDSLWNLLQLDDAQRAARTAESLDVNVKHIAGQLAQRLQKTVRLQVCAAPEADSGIRRMYARSERILIGLGYQLLGDYELLNDTEMTGQSVRMRMLISADQRSVATISCGVQGPVALDRIEFESQLQDGRILSTNNIGNARACDFPGEIELQTFEYGTWIKPMDRSHQQRLLEAGSPALLITDLQAVLDLLERKRELKLRHAQRIGGVSDRELAGVLGASYPRLEAQVRQHLAKLLGAT